MDQPTQKVNKRSQRRDNRICVIQFLYQWELNKPEELADAVCAFLEGRERPRDYYSFAEELIYGAIENMGEIDEQI
ncbi:MAG: transcription antitermination factor NusB, partial [Verrucomicrobiota bacterium]|nr:transcription antitermination factor NusB [Verrucomicrobiota bacterium]